MKIKGLTRIVGEGQVIDGLTARLLMEKYPSPASIFNRSFSESIYDVVILFLKENQLYEVAKMIRKPYVFTFLLLVVYNDSTKIKWKWSKRKSAVSPFHSWRKIT